MKCLASLSFGLLLLAQTAFASTAWQIASIRTTPANAPKVLAATDKLMASEPMKAFPGRVLLQVHLADGTDPATHSFVTLYKSAAEREKFQQTLLGQPAWNEFLNTLTSLGEPVASTRYTRVKSWGDIVDTDDVWETHPFAVSDPAAFVAALDALMASPTGKKFPGQVHLSAMAGGGITPVTHVVSVGWASEAEAEAWANTLQGNADWAKYLADSRKAADHLGLNVVRDLKEWGPATLGELTAP